MNLTGTVAIDGTGNALANTILGNAGANVLTGGAGDDVLIGGAGADRMVGGVGNDTYDVNSTGDVISEGANAGDDRVWSSVNYGLGANIEDLILTGDIAIIGQGNNLNNTIVGNSADNFLHGYGGDDLVMGGDGRDDIYGGAGKDVLMGGTGDDHIFVEGIEELNSGDVYDGGEDFDIFETFLIGQVLDFSGINIKNIEGISVGNIRISVSQLSSFSYIEAGSIEITTAGVIDLATKVYCAVSEVTFSNFGNRLDLTGVVSSSDRIIIHGGAGADTVTGPASAVGIFGAGGDDRLVAGPANALLDGGAGDDVLLGGNGNDSLRGGAGADILQGGGGDDFLTIGEGDAGTFEALDARDDIRSGDVYDGGAGHDMLTVTGDALATIDLSGLSLISIEGLNSWFQNTKLTVGQLASLTDIKANTLVVADGGSVNLSAKAGLEIFKVILSDAGNVLTLPATTVNFSIPSVEGGQGADTIVALGGYTEIHGGGGNDVFYGASGFDWVFGDAGNDTLRGAGGSDTLEGGLGDDRLSGGAGDDGLIGGAGRDVLTGEEGDDKLYVDIADRLDGDVLDGGVGTDTLYIAGTSGELDASRLLAGVEVLRALDPVADVGVAVSVAQFNQLQDVQIDSLRIVDGGQLQTSQMLRFIGTLHLSDGGNSIQVTDGNGPALIYGGAGNDIIQTDWEQSAVFGGGGNDSLTGSAGRDTLAGNAGDDTLRGGAGEDRFVFSTAQEGRDTIADFTSSEGDHLVFQGLLHGAFAYLGAAAFTAGGHTEARFAGGQLFVDIDGNGTSDITVNLTGITAASQLHASDFTFS